MIHEHVLQSLPIAMSVSTSSLYFRIQSEAKCVGGLYHLKLDRGRAFFLSRASFFESQLRRFQESCSDLHNALLQLSRFD